MPRNAIFELYLTNHDWKFQSFNVTFVSYKPQKKSAKGKEKKLKRKEVIIVSIYLYTVTLSMQTNIHRKFIKLILKLKRWILCKLCAFVFSAGTDEPLTCTRSPSAACFSPILITKNLLLISNMAHLTIEVFACFYFACHYNWRSPIVSFFLFLMYPVLFETLGDPHVKVIGMPLIPSVNCYFVTSCCSTNWRRFDTCAKLVWSTRGFFNTTETTSNFWRFSW